MDCGKVEYSFFWNIENYSHCWHQNGQKLISPDFTTVELDGTAWNLWLFPRGHERKDKGHISLFLFRNAEDDGPESISVQCKFSVHTANGTPISSREFQFAYKKEYARGIKNFLKMDEVLLRKQADYLPQDTLTLCCKIRKGEGNVVRNIGLSSAQTRIKVERIYFLHEVEKFSTLQPNVKQKIEVPSQSKDKRFISSSLYFTELLNCEEKIMIEIVPSDNNRSLRKCDLYLLDASGNEVGCGKADVRFVTEGKSIRTLPLSLTRKVLLNRKSEYLPNDKLTLLCECSFSSGLEFETVGETHHGMCRAAVKQTRYQMHSKNDDSNSVEKTSAYPSALEDLKSLYINSAFTDVELKTKTKSFPAHKVVLCARSAVFRQMMSSDMRENHTNCIEMDDLEEHVVEQLLSFLYSDTVEDLEWTLATRLYSASDKYEVGKLKEVCSSFLVANLTPTKAGDLLLLADSHSDADLKKSVEDFILDHEGEVFGSEEWERLMETNPVLVMKAMHLKYKRI